MQSSLLGNYKQQFPHSTGNYINHILMTDINLSKQPVRSGIVRVALLKIQDSHNVTLCCGAILLGRLGPADKNALQSFQTQGSTQPTTQHHIPHDLNLQNSNSSSITV